MNETICEISEPNFNIEHGCRNTCPNKSRTCITGSVKWTGMIGTVIRSDNLHSLNLSDDKDLIEILGSNVH